MKANPVWGQVLGGLVLLGAVSGGIWSSFNPDTAQTEGDTAQTPGLFSYHFTPGQQVRYRLVTQIRGTGTQSAQVSPISMDMGADMTLTTESVDSAGNGSLRLVLDSVGVSGSFMGGPFELWHTHDRTFMSSDGRITFDTALGQSTSGIPQLEFLDQPILMTIAPDGEVLRVSGMAGLDHLISPGAVVAPVEFGPQELPAGTQWQSSFNMPILGIATAPGGRMLNTLLGYQVVDGHQCAVIRQELLSSQAGGQIQTPSGALGESMGLSMPAFNLEAHNMVYFDVESGRLFRTDINLDTTMQIGNELKSITGMVDRIFQEMDDSPAGSQGQSQNNEVGVNIKATMVAL